MISNVLLHIVVMAVGFIFVLIGAVIGAKDVGEKKINLHKTIGVLGVLIFLLGFIGLLATGSLKPNLPHFYFAILSLIFAILTIIGGIAYTRAQIENKLPLRKSHRADAILTIMLVLITTFFGVIGLQFLSK
ncbi:hypothetical protein [Caldisericum exile]|uniref:Hypothetical membrane protein n=1 Tax=Caldisericum exile (strain DSM 21853 / NBRC 104410 / AZM16c01) TaxID=511051 RepID=A0A7U6GDF7_CALEA|nr:hypothetical protein [Caldisericum exile]BAL80370.1 hypothetical membrane protein [Caldisericum exile AZM16c01]